MKITRIAKDVEKTLKSPKKREEEVFHQEDFLSTGSTLLNLALSDSVNGGYPKGHYVFLVGDSASGKTFSSMTCLAEAARNPAFDNYEFIYDNVEDGMLMDVPRLFGKRVSDRLRPPSKTKNGVPVFSETIEDFYFHIDDALKSGKPFLYILDSMDALSSEDEQKKFEEQKKAARKDKKGKIAGSYGDGKAKKNSAGIRRLLAGLKRTGSILIIICQTRDNLNASWGETKTRSGGRALRFYATTEFWSSVVKQIKKEVRGRERQIGSYIQFKVRKNRVTGKLNEVETAIYPSYGIDDIGSCIDFLTAEKWWPKTSGVIKAKELGVEMKRNALIRHCEEHEEKLKKVVQKCWDAIEAEKKLERRARYT